MITRDVAVGTRALTGPLVVCNATDRQPDVICAWGTVQSEGRLSLCDWRSGFVGRVLESERTAGEPIAAGQEAALALAASGARVAYAVGASVRAPGDTPGALCVGLPAMPRNPSTIMWIVESYARIAALCVHDAGALRGFLAAARHDALTGCLNYAATRTELDREIGRSARRGSTLSCCFIDLDRFKQVNEHRGHLEGSRVLASVARALRTGVRIGDSVGRYGGDEFVVLLPDTDSDAARALAERLRARICTTSVERGHKPLDASIGVAQWRAGTTAEELLVAAADALRAAKRLGGGAVVGAGDVAAGVGRGVVGVLSDDDAPAHELAGVGGPHLANPPPPRY